MSLNEDQKIAELSGNKRPLDASVGGGKKVKTTLCESGGKYYGNKRPLDASVGGGKKLKTTLCESGGKYYKHEEEGGWGGEGEWGWGGGGEEDEDPVPAHPDPVQENLQPLFFVLITKTDLDLAGRLKFPAEVDLLVENPTVLTIVPEHEASPFPLKVRVRRNGQLIARRHSWGQFCMEYDLCEGAIIEFFPRNDLNSFIVRVNWPEEVLAQEDEGEVFIETDPPSDSPPSSGE